MIDVAGELRAFASALADPVVHDRLALFDDVAVEGVLRDLAADDPIGERLEGELVLVCPVVERDREGRREPERREGTVDAAPSVALQQRREEVVGGMSNLAVAEGWSTNTKLSRGQTALTDSYVDTTIKDCKNIMTEPTVRAKVLDAEQKCPKHLNPSIVSTRWRSGPSRLQLGL